MKTTAAPQDGNTTQYCMVELATINGGVHYAKGVLDKNARRVDLLDRSHTESLFGSLDHLRVVAVQTEPSKMQLTTRPTLIAMAVHHAFRRY